MKSNGLRIAGGILALVASIGGAIAGFVTIFLGAAAKVVGDYTTTHGNVSGADYIYAGQMARQGEGVMGLGWLGILASFLALVLGIVILCSKSQKTAWMLLVSAILGIICGGTFVAFFMVLALLGAIFALLGGRKISAAR